MLFEDSVLEPGARDLLKQLGSGIPELEPFHLVGGTALALQFGHRLSIDLDLFTPTAFDGDRMLEAIYAVIPSSDVRVDGRAENTLNLSIREVKVDLIRYAYPLLQPLIETETYRMLAVPDIAAMKLSAIANRGSKKDFFDLHLLLQHYTLKELLEFYESKFPNHDPFSVIRSLAYFDDAEPEPDPVMLTDTVWSGVKALIGAEIRGLA